MGKRKDRIMKLLQNLKKDKKGFTLVEMIVVIVIIGILLAILVPGMFKYIDKAKDKQIEVNARTAYLNISTAIAELYGKNGVTAEMVNNQFKNETDTFSNDTKKGRMTLSATPDGTAVTVDIEAFPNDVGVVSKVVLSLPEGDNSKFEIAEMIYTEENKSVEMKNGVWNVK